MNNKNKGMYIESLINKSIIYYIDNNICFMEKRNIPISIISKNKDKTICKILEKSYVDYFGMIDSKFISFETKQTNNDFFDLKQLKKHQYEHLKYIHDLKGFSFLIIHFYCYDKTFLLSFNFLQNLIGKKIKKLFLNEIKNCTNNIDICELTIVFPGILDLYEKIKNLI